MIFHLRRAVARPSTSPRINFHLLPAPILHRVLSHLSTAQLTPLLTTSPPLRTLTLLHLSQRRLRTQQQQSPSTAATALPNELLVEIFTYLGPLDFYYSTLTCSAWRCAGSYTGLVRRNVHAVQPVDTVPPPAEAAGQLKTLSFYLQCAGHLGLRGPGVGREVGTWYTDGDVRVSENAEYVLVSDPQGVHVYSTYQSVGGTQGGLELKARPTWMVTIPGAGRVVDASFGHTVLGGGVDVVVLYEGLTAQLYKIRPVAKRRRLLRWMRTETAPQWAVCDSLLLQGVCPLRGPVKVRRLDDRMERVLIAGAGELEVWEGCRRRWDLHFDMTGVVTGIYTGRIWHSGVGADVDWIMLSHAPRSTDKHKAKACVILMPKGAPDTGCSTTISPTQRLFFDYAMLTHISGSTWGAPQFIGLTSPHTLTHLQLTPSLPAPLSPSLDTSASAHPYTSPCTLVVKAQLGAPTTSSSITHIATIMTPLSPVSPVVVTATDTGVLYVYVPLHSSPDRVGSWRRIARIPPDTGGRIAAVKVAFRAGLLVIVVATDVGRVEVCYVDFELRGFPGGLEGVKAGRRWDLKGQVVEERRG